MKNLDTVITIKAPTNWDIYIPNSENFNSVYIVYSNVGNKSALILAANKAFAVNKDDSESREKHSGGKTPEMYLRTPRGEVFAYKVANIQAMRCSYLIESCSYTGSIAGEQFRELRKEIFLMINRGTGFEEFCTDDDSCTTQEVTDNTDSSDGEIHARFAQSNSR